MEEYVEAHRLVQGRPLRVLVPQLAPGTAAGNPELRLLYDAMLLQEDVVVQPFSRWSAVRQKWDITHFYWPEWSIKRNRGGLLMLLDACIFFAVLRWMKARGTKVVWSLNNLLPHEPDRRGLIDWFIHAFARRVDHLTCSSQTLLEEFLLEYPILRGTDVCIHPSSHYKGVYPDDAPSKAEARTRLGLPANATVLLSLGMLRRYKNTRHLIRCFKEFAATRPDAFLLIAGPTLDDHFISQLQGEARGHDRIRIDLKYVEPQEMQYYLRAADCLVWPAIFPGNSSTVMVALSYDCPVLVPFRGAFVEMQEALGRRWVRTYQGGLRADVLSIAVEPAPPGSIDLPDRYSWDAAATEYLRVYHDLTPV